MKISGTWMGVIFVIFGVLVLVFPESLRWLVGVFFIVSGILALIKK
jgi:uncharacterized membrane protein HdeD (DUF308 family)